MKLESLFAARNLRRIRTSSPNNSCHKTTLSAERKINAIINTKRVIRGFVIKYCIYESKHIGYKLHFV